MTLFYSLSVAPVVIAAVVALVPWLLRAPRTSVATGAVRTSTAVAAGVILLVAIVVDSVINPRDEQTSQQGDI